ncbi:Heterokaryon incompatibility protein (HET) [Geosmithia morbida]|uniref:Heterokaryon incompatibility protein (HET) n=1 Tax=Geosmithia morbida TaxID=1094350 RepID=A0A9P5D1N1_9HYPO|nr:Heterokaryon incompatibility protein (HET) [Geosmithia morbida]KAF4119990.1 Heterokaryon incompatibility protein (HET) [Geosmithia morbida]
MLLDHPLFSTSSLWRALVMPNLDKLRQRDFGRICRPVLISQNDGGHDGEPSPRPARDHDECTSTTAATDDRGTCPPSMPIRSRRTPELCPACAGIDFGGFLEEEKAEQNLGRLGSYLDDDCPFCSLIFQGVQSHWGKGWTPERLCAESGSPPTLFIQSKSPTAVRKHGRVHYPHPRLLLALDVEAPGYSENRRVIRELDRVKNRHIIAEIEAVHDEEDTSGDDSWLHQCNSHKHTAQARRQMEQGAVDIDFFKSRCGFRLIDVEQECLVLKTEPCTFAALSYVWGRLPTVLKPSEDGSELPILLSTKQSLKRLGAAGGLSQANVRDVEHARLPQTIIDAMEFSRRIGMRYLWIDTLCIVQDDPTDKCFLIQAMDSIYGIATVTYIAVSGGNADAGLRGVSPRRGRPVEATEIMDNGTRHRLSLSPPSLNEEVRTSPWDTRGWTFQEQALSQRCLYFTENELFFNCIECLRREAYDIESAYERPGIKFRTGPPWWTRNLRKDPDPTPYRYLGDLAGTLTAQDYQAAVQAYSRRTLSFPEDVLAAFEGVFNRFSRRSTCDDLVLHQTQGIPVEHMHRAMLWFPSDEAKRRLYGGEASADRFSTWSWASWSGPIEFMFADSMWISRNISLAPAKKIPMHVLIPFWHYGGTDKRFYSQGIWKAACEVTDQADGGDGKVEGECCRSMRYAREKIGLDMDRLLDHARDDTARTVKLVQGQLAFWGACVYARQATLQLKSGRVRQLRIGLHAGEFRFDGGDAEVDEYVAVVTSDTITKPPDTVCILLGLRTRNGPSKRVGLGWIYLSREAGVVPPPWTYKLFKVA